MPRPGLPASFPPRAPALGAEEGGPPARPAALTGSCRWTAGGRSAGSRRRAARCAATAAAWWAGAPGGLAGPAGRAPGPGAAGVSAALPEVGRRRRALGTLACGSLRGGLRCPAARAAHRPGAGARGGGGAGRGHQGASAPTGPPSVDRSEPALSLARPHVSKSPEARRCHWPRCPYIRLPAGGCFKGEADPSARREPPPGLAQTALAGTPSPQLGEPHSPGCAGGCTWGERRGWPRGGVGSPGLCCAVCARVHVPACAWAPAAAWARPWGAGVCTHMHGVRRAPCRPVSLAAGRGPSRCGRAGLTCAHAHWRLQGRPPSLLGEAHSGRAPQQVHRAPALAPPLLLLSLGGWCSKRGHPFRGTLFQ